MKRLDTDTLKTLLRRKAIGGAIVLYGEEDYLKNLSAGRVISAYVEEAARSFDFTELFQELDIGRLRDLTMALPMLSEKRVVLLRDPDIYAGGDEQAESLARLIAELPEECVLIFLFINQPLSFEQPKGRPDRKVARALKVFADANVVSCDRLPPDKAEVWITSLLAEKGVAIERRTARKLAEICAGDMYAIKNNADILAASGEKAVTEAMLSAVTYNTVEEDSFRLADAIADGRYADAYSILDELASTKADPREFMPTVISGFVAMYRVAVARDKTGSWAPLEGKFSYVKSNYPLKRAAARLKGRPTEYFRKAALLCVNAERRLKRDFAGYEVYYELIGGLAALGEKE
ncbi:MAG: DNA polymerase III subunit delta [Clostridia bacterium]|nr:DNA polymerase III subunit delta [Clostridia bacterium]